MRDAWNRERRRMRILYTYAISILYHIRKAVREKRKFFDAFAAKHTLEVLQELFG